MSLPLGVPLVAKLWVESFALGTMVTLAVADDVSRAIGQWGTTGLWIGAVVGVHRLLRSAYREALSIKTETIAQLVEAKTDAEHARDTAQEQLADMQARMDPDPDPNP